jgi:son of sevenless
MLFFFFSIFLIFSLFFAKKNNKTNSLQVLMDMFYQGENVHSIVSPLPPPITPRDGLTYEEVVKELLHDEKQYLRDLHMIIRVFREELIKIVDDPRELDPIFSNIIDIYELTVTLLGSLEDVIEMSQEQTTPCIGSCFEGNTKKKINTHS